MDNASCHYPQSCHSERSEESLKLLKINMMRFLAALGMTGWGRCGTEIVGELRIKN